jgi:hypothetical protein
MAVVPAAGRGTVVVMAVIRRASRTDAEMLLAAARDDGDVFAYDWNAELGRWFVEVQPTRYDAYHHEDARGVLALTTREVLAFIEGRWAARRVQPVHRAGDPDAR